MNGKTKSKEIFMSDENESKQLPSYTVNNLPKKFTGKAFMKYNSEIAFYEGDFVVGKLQGKGKKKFNNGDFYEGEFYDDDLNGYGKMTYKNGKVKEGKWSGGRFRGKAKKPKEPKEGEIGRKGLILSIGKLGIFFLIGYSLQVLSKAHLGDGLPIAPDWRDDINALIMMLGTGVMFLPMWWSFIRGGFMAFLQVPNYAVITTTTYSDGTVTKSSDHGQEAMDQALILKVIWFVIGYFLAAFVTLGILAFQVFTFVTKFNKVKNKLSYTITLLVVFAYLAYGSALAIKLGPIVDKEHFNPVEITRVMDSAEKTLFAGNFSYTIGTFYKKKEVAKHSLDVDVKYTKASDTTVITVKPQGQTAQTYLQEFDKGKNLMLFGTYTFKGNELTNTQIDTELCGSRTMSEAGIAAVTDLLPVNFIFKRIADDKKRLRIINMDHLNIDTDVSIRAPEKSDKKKRRTLDFVKTGNGGYKLTEMWIAPYFPWGGRGEIKY
jgi:hypothetical protein